MEFSLGLTNNLGRAEDVTITAELGSQNSTEFSVSIAKPRLQGTSVGSQFQVAQQSRCLQQYSSYTEDTRKTAVTLYRCDSMQRTCGISGLSNTCPYHPGCDAFSMLPAL